MPFIASNGLTEAGTSKTIAVGGINVHYHDLGEGEPVLFLHSYGPGTTAGITVHKTVGELSQHFRCILMDLPNFSKRARSSMLDSLGIARGQPAARLHTRPRRHPAAGSLDDGRYHRTVPFEVSIAILNQSHATSETGRVE